MAEEDDKNVPEYKVGKKVGINELLSQDQDDESLRKYKESLLGKIDAASARTVLVLIILVVIHPSSKGRSSQSSYKGDEDCV